VIEKNTITELYMADEIFTYGTAAEIVPVANIDVEIIGNDKVGSITKKLIAQFRKLTKGQK